VDTQSLPNGRLNPLKRQWVRSIQPFSGFFETVFHLQNTEEDGIH